MNRSTLILALVLLVFLIQAGLLLQPAAGIKQKLMGGVYLCLCILIVFQGNMKIGRLSERNAPAAPANNRTTQDTARLKRILTDSIAPEFHKMGQVGLVVGGYFQGREAIVSFGSKTLHADARPQNDTIFEIGSVSKLFTAGLLAASVKKNLLPPDTKVCDLVNSSNSLNSNSRKITLEHLVTHTSGLPRMSADIFLPLELCRSLAGSTPYHLYSREKVMHIFLDSAPSFTPGTRIKYSNTGFGLLGLLLAEQSGKSYDRLLQETITDPLEMDDTVLHLNREQQQRSAEGYRGFYRFGRLYLSQHAAPSNFGEGLVAAGGIHSTAKDMLRFIDANLNGKTGISSFLQLTHTIRHQYKDMQVGMGWFAENLPKSGQSVLYHNGISGGFSSFISIDTEHRIGVVLLGNVSRPMDTWGRALMDHCITEFSPDHSR